jgi:hypothetical protein
MTEFMFMTIILYVTTNITYFFYWLTLHRVAKLVNSSVKGSKSRKALSAVMDESVLNMKLSILWPFALCRLIIVKIKSL